MNILEENITEFKTDFPKSWSFLWSPEEAEKISEEHKDQIHFLNKKGTKIVKEYLNYSKMLGYSTGTEWSPFTKGYFKTEKKFLVTIDCDSEIKKWLYNLGIPFDKYVFVDSDNSGQSIMLTWKMVIKYWEGMFWDTDLTIFDGSLNWALFYYHESQLFFGKDNVFDQEAEFKKNLEQNKLLNEIKNRIK
ncbi:hypothetical protein [Gaetbulibacter sp. PBL-D1]|uniref:hypothetical protein n=1 Tax=Gaetbulibacter sp. PBL-D1 TaxID=3422594 RepID=UPI003D2EC991